MPRRPTLSAPKMADDIAADVVRAVSSGAAERMRALRARRASGRVVFRVEVDEVDTEELLIARGLLSEREADCRASVEAALGRLIEDLARHA